MMAPRKKIIPLKDYKTSDYKCTQCSKVFKDIYAYKTHTETHNNELPYSCDLCEYRCKVKKYLSRHKKKVHTKANGPACTVCGKVFHYNSSLKKHMVVHTGERPYKCKVCKKTFSSTYCLSVHKLIHTDEKPFQCKFCEYACRDSSTLRRHEERHMGIYKTFPCEKCKKVFNTKLRLKLHVDEAHYGLDTRRIGCEHCDKKFKTISGKNTHIKTVHKRVDREKCEICDRLISRNNMGAHLISHVNIRPYKCSYKNCHKRFKDRSALKKHTPIHYPELYYQCDLCDSRFVRELRMKRHRMWHVANGYTCDHCGGTFSTKTYLQLHITKKHGSSVDKYICDECKTVLYSKRSIILHIKYGHGYSDEINCRICGDVLRNNAYLTEHYLKVHKLKHITKKPEGYDVVKKEPEDTEVSQDFEFNYEIQKVEVNDPSYVESEQLLSNDKNILDISDSTIDIRKPESTFEEFYKRVIQTKFRTSEYAPECADTETTLAYSEKVLEEDITRIIRERNRRDPENSSDEIFTRKFVDKSKKVARKEIVDKSKLGEVQKSIDKMLTECRMKKTSITLQKMREEYNRRIEMINKIREKKETTQIKYYKKPENFSNNTQGGENNQENDDKSNDNTLQNNDVELNTNENNIDDSEKQSDVTMSRRKRNNRKMIRYDNGEDNDIADDGTKDGNGKLKFDGHECYICFKIFKTKNELKNHCKEHFGICNEKMLTKCPFCGYVTNRNIKRHIELVHKMNIKYAYGQVAEKPNSTGSKYVFEIDQDCELEIIPSISNLNKIACMKIDERNRKNNNLFMGKTKLVKKGGEWMIEKEAISINNDNLLPEFTDDEYKSLKITGNSYFDQMKQLGVLAKKRGIRMLYPCEGCEKICQTLSALKLHNRKHEANPKQFKPKIWVNRHVEYKTRNRKRIRCSNKTIQKSKEKPCRTVPMRMTDNKKIPNNSSLENRYAAPQPVKNNHKCDKKLIEFYKANIRGKDIEFWQFLKIYNKMNRENVNDFDDLVNRNDVHFGLHTRDDVEPTTTQYESGS